MEKSKRNGKKIYDVYYRKGKKQMKTMQAHIV